MCVNLVCPSFRRVISVVKITSIGLNIVVVLLVLFFSLCGVFENTRTGILFSTIILVFSGLLLIPGLYYERVSHSFVSISNEEIRVLDKNGCCWRVFSLNCISYLQVKEIAGFFYGKNRMNAKDTYLCIFLNGATEIPEASYHRLFFQDDFFLVSYDKAFADCLANITGLCLESKG